MDADASAVADAGDDADVLGQLMGTRMLNADASTVADAYVGAEDADLLGQLLMLMLMLMLMMMLMLRMLIFWANY